MLQFKKTAIAIALAAGMISAGAQAAQVSAAGFATTSSPTSSSNNNFTMLNGTGGFIGGNNDVAMTWDGTVFNSNSDYTGPGGASNMTLSSPSTFFGYNWTAHDVQVFAPGSYSFNTALGGGNAEAGTQNLTVGAGQLGAHMLFDWNGNFNIDVSVLWNANGVFGTTAAQRTLTGTAVWNAVSVDGDGLGGPGIKMALGGPFQNSQANFNLNGITPAAVPLPAAVWLLGSGLIGMVGVARRRKSGNTKAA